MKNALQLGQNIRRRRKNLGLTQRDVALCCGCGLRVIGDIEKGKATCQIDKILAVLEAIGLTIHLVPRD